jgi:PEP-CTERM motif-containing protein
MNMIRRVLSRGICVGAIALLGICLPTQRADAEPITTVIVTSGSLTYFVNSTEFDFTGTEGFSLRGTSDNAIPFCFACQPGETQELSAHLSGSLEAGSTGTFRGQTYAFDFNHGGSNVNFDAPPVTLPAPPPGSTAEFTQPFSLVTSGPLRSLVFFEPDDPTQGFEVALRGSGTVTLFTDINRLNPEPGLYETQSVRYDFAATPEPGSLILIGTGIAVAWRRRHCAQL